MVNPEFVLTVVGTGMGIIIAMGAIVITLFLWTRNEGNADRRESAKEMKDFHEKSARLEQEFRERLLIIEERRNKIIFKE